MTDNAAAKTALSRQIFWSGEISARFRTIAILLYLAAMGAHLIYVWRNDCGFAFITPGPAAYVGFLLVLMGFEIWAHQRYGDQMTRLVGIWLIGTRVVLYEIAASMDCTSFAIIFYMLVPYLAYLLIDKWAAIAMSAVFVGWTAYKVGAFRCLDCPLDERITPIVLLGFGLVWSTAMGGLVRLLEANRARTRQLLEDQNRSHQSLKYYASRIEQLTAAEERNRLARDIHDNVGHSLAVVNVQLEKALVYQGQDREITREAMQQARRAAREAIQELRESVHTLRDSSEGFSLAVALDRLLKQFTVAEAENILQFEGDETDFSQSSLMVLYRAAQEGLTNIYKHSNADRVIINVRLGKSEATMEIRDNGKGFNPDSLTNLPAGRTGKYGLQGIRERLELVGGRLNIESSNEGGTVLLLVLPKSEREAPLPAQAEAGE